MSRRGQRPDPRRFQLIPRTLIFARRADAVLLQRVAEGRGEWAGLWNGVGGHVEAGESPLDAARREFLEETGLTLEAPRLAGTLVVDLGPPPGLVLFIFTGMAGAGEPEASQEGELGWFAERAVATLPTVADLPRLLPRVLAGGPPFTARSWYDADGALRVRFDGADEGA